MFSLLLASLLLLTSQCDVPAVALVPGVAGIHAIDGVPGVAGITAFAGAPGFACVLAVANIPADPGVPNFIGVFSYCIAHMIPTVLNYWTICLRFEPSTYLAAVRRTNKRTSPHHI